MLYENDLVQVKKTPSLQENIEDDDSVEEQINSIRDHFHSDKGDLMYGLSDERGHYIRNVIGQNFKPEKKETPAVVIDMYNNTIALETNMALLGGPLEKFLKSPEKNMKKMLPPDDIQARVQKTRNYPLWKSYFAAGESNRKFNVHEIYKEMRREYGSSPYHQWHINGGDSAPKLLWKRGSKLGLEIAAQSTGNRIHFVLDGLDIPSIVRKEGAGGQSITASELRYAYRNKERLKGKIFFYQNNAPVAAPWETDPELWSQYTQTPKGGELQPVPKGRFNQLYSSIRRAFKR